MIPYQGQIQDFKLGGAHLKKNAHLKKCGLKKIRQKIIFFPMAEGGAKIVGVFRVKNHDFTPKNHIFFQL